MIIQSNESQAKTSLADLLGGNSKNSSTKSSDLFSKLLGSFGQSKTDESKIVKSNDFKAIIDPKNSSTKNLEIKSSSFKELQSLLTGSEEKESALVSKELLGSLSEDQVRTLMNRAKDYLKNEITSKKPEYKLDSASLPKTLGGLVELAKKMGLEPQSISLSTLVNDSEEKVPFPSELLSKPLLETKALAALPSASQEDISMETLAQLINEIKNKEQKSTKTSASESVENVISEKAETEPLKTLLQTLDKRESSEAVTETSASTQEGEVKTAASAQQTTKTDTLIALLQGTNENKETQGESGSSLKVEGEGAKTAHPLKADSLEVKSKEAQQSMRLFASDLKEAVQEYKPPFTRLTMKLNPEKLGEVEVTLVQRGNNVHVNIQSTNANSVAFLAHNATELKAQLAHQGITNATMNFMSGGENGQQAQQQHQQEQQQNRFRSYESFEELELNEEQISALEIVIPNYA